MTSPPPDPFLVTLGDAVRTLADPVAIQSVATRLLGERLGASRVLYGEVADQGDTIVFGADHYLDGAPSGVGRHRIEDFGGLFGERLRAGVTHVLQDSERAPGLTPDQRRAWAAAGARAHITVPLVKDGGVRAVLSVSQTTARAWSAEEVAVVEETAERTWAAVERARAEQALRRSEARYRSLFESIDEGFCVVELQLDADGRAHDYRFLEANPVFERQTGLVGAVGRTARELVPNLEAHWFEIYGRVAATGQSLRFVQGSEAMGRWFDVYAFRIGEPEQRQVAILFNDVTARRAAEAALRESGERFRRMADAAPAILWITGPDGTSTFRSRGWYELTGQSETDARDRGWLEAVHPDDRSGTEQAYRAAAERREPFAVDYRLRRADGEYRWVADAGRPHAAPDGAYLGLVGAVIDIHARMQAEEQLRQAAKMEAIGRLAGGIAHDFNNQLHAVAGFAAFVARDPGLGARARRDVEEIRRATDRMAGLTRQLLAFSRRQMLQPETLQLNEAVLEGSSLLRRLIGSDVEMALDLTSEPTWVRVDPAQLLQVLMNLAINARDAMPSGGRLEVRTGAREVTPEDPLVRGPERVVPGRYVLLSVTDTGTGIAPEHMAHIFEPFFTTKDVGEGTGLGLATVHGIVSQSRGHVWAASEPGRGTTFTVLLPAESGADASAMASPLGPRPPARRARILVVDDEGIVRDVVSRTLEEEGYEVVQARGGLDALELLARPDGAVDLVLSDVVMPGLAARELEERLRREHPAVPLVWMSGYPRDSALVHLEGATAAPFLQKPIPPEVLVRTIQELVASTRPPS